ncbi:hypothetical protein IQ06DRAFT_356896 [Phaeosphaeriaceae sp. SRC1lsM3a]|nr:hypothetical protein IQ06DRAFT_356896 [Stagonospora sp. SRC1lsM3a]
MGCRFVGGQGGAAGSCTAFPGVLSNREIRRIIKDEGITPYFNTTAMVKYFKYAGDSWVGYDDAETYALKEEYANNRCLGGIMIWSIDFDDETGGGIGLDTPNNFRSPESATIIPMSHTTVPAGQTFTLGSGASTDIPRLPNGGSQNSPQGPGADKCSQCSFFRRITSTCCGTGGSVANPILIPAGVPTPMDIPLPAGFTPNQSFQDASGNTVPANKPLPQETILPQGTIFTQPFLIAPGTTLREGEGDDQSSNSSSLVWLSPDIWNNPNPNVQCFFPCTLVLPPWPSLTSTIDYPRITVTESGSIKTTLTFPPLTISRWEPETIVINNQESCTTSCTDNDNRLRTSSVKISTTTTWPPPDDPDPEDEVDKDDLTCALDPDDPDAGGEDGGDDEGWTTTTTVTPGGGITTRVTTIFTTLPVTTPRTTTTVITTKQPEQTATPKKSPDFSKDQVKCYDSGQVANRGKLISTADGWCKSNKNKKLESKYYSGELRAAFSCCDTRDEVVPVEVKYSVEVHDGCEWKVDENTCKAEFRKVIDGCDRNTEARKQGGRLVGDCMTWRIDPNAQT